MTPTQLETWMASLDLNKLNAAKELDIGRARLDRFLAGTSPIPRHIELACEALSLRWKRE
jgi:hypothetical protein